MSAGSEALPNKGLLSDKEMMKLIDDGHIKNVPLESDHYTDKSSVQAGSLGLHIGDTLHQNAARHLKSVTNCFTKVCITL